jgi:hypothetical protein
MAAAPALKMDDGTKRREAAGKQVNLVVGRR